MKELLNIISTIDCKGKESINPTEIYNEGWMTRLLMYYSIKKKKTFAGIDFKHLKRWTSEGLISSPFVHAQQNREGYTHADMVLGDFSIDYEKRGEIIADNMAEIFGIIEAKMGSPLSSGTKNAPNYNQASRNVACIAFNTDKNCKTFFYVVAPECKKSEIIIKLNTNIIETQIKDRYVLSNMPVDQDLVSKASSCEKDIITYEEWISIFNGRDRRKLQDFYNKCLKWNNIKK